MKSNKKGKFLIKLAILAIVIIAISIIVYFKMNKSTKSSPITANQYTKGQTNNSKTKNGSSNSPSMATVKHSNSTSGSPVNNNQSNLALLSPSGNYVSNHNPGANNTPSTETSVCNTTPGATCQISFNQGIVTKYLPTQITNQSGTTYWNNWNPQGIGLYAGKWTIKATSSLNGSSKSSYDAMQLTIN